jgi:hypothetical protein
MRVAIAPLAEKTLVQIDVWRRSPIAGGKTGPARANLAIGSLK